MNEFIIMLANLSIVSSILIAVVIFLRWAFKKAPKWITGILWAIVGLRLLIPFYIESSIGILRDTNPIPSIPYIPAVQESSG